MDEDELEVISFDVYIDDLRQEIVRVDQSALGRFGHPTPQIFVVDHAVPVGLSGFHVAELTSFLLDVPPLAEMIEVNNVTRLVRHCECYAIWRTGVIKILDWLFRHPSLSGIGDAGIKEFWFLKAIAVVRCRALYHSEWFPKVRIRTLRSMRQHAGLFDQDVFSILRELSKLHANSLSNEAELDIHLTQQLVATALERGHTLEEALALIVTD